MPRISAASRLSRLDELASLLKAGELTTVAELAATLSVTPRTISRDIGLLRVRGIPLQASVGRGGGIRLYRDWPLSRTLLDHQEAINLLLALALAERLGSSLLLQSTGSLRNKLLSTFSPGETKNILKLRRRVLVRAPASEAVRQIHSQTTSDAIRSAVQQGFFEMRVVRIQYTDSVGARTLRDVEPQYLLLAWPVWYLLAWDHLRNDVRAFRFDKISSASVSDRNFELKPERIFESLIKEIGEPI